MVDTSEQRNAQETEERPCGLFWVFAALHGLWRAAESPEQPVQRGGPGRVGAEHPVRRRAAVLHAPAASAHPQPGLQVDHRGLHVWLCRLLHRKLLRQLVHSDPHLHPAGAGGRPAVVHTVHLPDHHGERECQEGGEARQGRGEPVLRHLLPHLPVVRRVGQLDLLSGLRPDAQQRVHFGGAAHILRGQRLPHGHQAQQQHPAALPGAGLHPAGHLHRPWNVFEEQRSVRVSSGERSPHPAGDQKSKGSGILAILLIAVFLEPIQDDRRDCAEEKQPPFWSTLLSTFRLFKDRRLRLLVLLPLYSGLQQGFLSGEYTRSYVTCALGIQFVGYVMICFSAIDSLCSLLYGRLSQYTGRIALYLLGAGTQMSCAIALLLWRPHPDHLAVYFVFPGLWGVADAVWQTQNNALYGVLFEKDKEAAFSNYRLWEALGFVIAFGYSTFLCVYIKLYILLGVLTLTMAAYLTVEYLEYKNAVEPLSPTQSNPGEEGETQTKM
ncbi:protein unc-93 homolog A isoform X1 [Nycticebus coucang]|uniref:protein unc-93 homolog A isoform X1 n=1 Tax=Nycticebus coucang TaxID=9470 RepID=UPI00234D9F01|nr:protein unc-93 homolog A isoform X1 [Nycticebus coucang]XP_053448690.1 protein unc-93 homolog A isoform X1 [Nycticebus coucang]